VTEVLRHPQSRIRRGWAAPIGAHLGALLLVLVGLTLVVGWQAPFSADEGAAAAQARMLADGDGWSAPHPFPEADPDGAAFPLARSTPTSEGWAPFAKHPTYSIVLAAADGLGGVPAMVVLSLVGTVAAAGIATALAGRLDESLARPALWVTGLASPLVFDAHLLMAHTLGAAAAGGATLCALRAASSRRWPAVAGTAALTALAVLLRNEAVLYAIALAAALLVVGTIRRRPGFSIAGLAAGGAGLSAMWAEPRLVGWLIPGGTGAEAVEVPASELGFVAGRVQGLVVTWLLPSYQVGLGTALLAISVLAVIVGAVIVRRRGDEQGIVVMAALAAGAAVARLALAPEVVPGLLVAFPLLVVAAILVRRSALSTDVAAVLAGTTLLFAAAVLATQYSTGGSGEWGGRYFALALPAAVPVALHVLRGAAAALGSQARRAALVGLVVTSTAIAASGILALRTVHGNTDRVVEATVDAARRDGPAGDGGTAVVLTSEEALPRLAWDRLDGARWLRTEPEDLAAMLERLDGLGVTELTFVTRDEARDHDPVTDGWRATDRQEPVDGSPWVILELHAV